MLMEIPGSVYHYIHIYIHIYMYIYSVHISCIYIHILYLFDPAVRDPPDPINHVYSLPGEYISKKCFTYRSIQIFKILFRGFYSQKSSKNLILRTRSCVTSFITQHSWLLHFPQAEICLLEMICTTVVPASKG